MNYLFIGGYFDGQRMDMPHQLAILTLPIPAQKDDCSSFKTQEYKLMKLVGEGNEFLIYVKVDMDARDVLRQLIDAYP